MADHLVVCIARQFGSAGHEIGKQLAEALGIGFYDKELLKAAADKSGITQEFFEKNDEKPTGGIVHAFPVTDGAKALSFADYTGFLPNDRMHQVVSEVITDAAEAGPCVIIGRCADYVLRGRTGTLSVFIHAPLEQRVQRIAKLHNIDEDAARALVRKTDRARANYYSFYTDRDWGAVDNYDIALDAGRLGTARAVELLKQAARP